MKELDRIADIYVKFQKDPGLFIFTMWGLRPQKVLPEYEQSLLLARESQDYSRINIAMFELFATGEMLTWQQQEIIIGVTNAVNWGCKKISIASGHGIGKSTILSMLIIWFLFCFKDCKVPCTAPTQGQMYDVLWSEIKKWVMRMPTGIKEMFDCTTDYIRMTAAPETWFARARTGKKENPEALAGLHADFMMLVVDEASGVPDQVFEASKSALTWDDTLLIMISNPTRLEGYFYNSHHKFKGDFSIFAFNSEHSPIVNRSFVDEIVREHGKDSDQYRYRVKWEFPDSSNADDTWYIPIVLESELRFWDMGFFGRKILGVDPSWEGKDTSEWVVRDWYTAKVVATEKTSSPKSIAAKTLDIWSRFWISAEDTVLDSFGVWAASTQELAMMGHRVRAINVWDPSENIEFLNLRADYYWQLREWIRRWWTLDNNIKWVEELPKIYFRRNIRNKIQIMPKDEMRKRGIRSPNVADAFMLTFAVSLDKALAGNFKGNSIKMQFDPYDD